MNINVRFIKTLFYKNQVTVIVDENIVCYIYNIYCINKILLYSVQCTLYMYII